LRCFDNLGIERDVISLNNMPQGTLPDLWILLEIVEDLCHERSVERSIPEARFKSLK